MKAVSTRAQCKIAVAKNGDGSYNIAIAAINIRPESCRRGTILKVIDVQQMLPVKIEFDGITVRPKLVLKMYRKMNIKDARAMAVWNKVAQQKAQFT